MMIKLKGVKVKWVGFVTLALSFSLQIYVCVFAYRYVCVHLYMHVCMYVTITCVNLGLEDIYGTNSEL